MALQIRDRPPRRPDADRLAYAREIVRGEAAALEQVAQRLDDAFLEAVDLCHRCAGRVAVTDKPDVLWDRPDLERLYARLEDEYELKERAEALFRKLSVISDTAEVLSDILDTKRSFRLEMIIVILIAVELVIAGYQTWLH